MRGLALYGPGATLFTIGQNNTAQQFDLNSPPVLVCDVQHPAPTLPPSPPVSIEEQRSTNTTPAMQDDFSVPVNLDIVSESDEEHMSPLARIAREMDKLEDMEHNMPDRSAALSPVSSQHSYTSRSSNGSRQHGVSRSQISRGMSDHTVMSFGTSIHSREPSIASRYTRDSHVSMHSSASNSSYRSRGKSSRLRQEILQSPEDKVVVELFKFTKARLSDIPYTNPKPPTDGKLTTDVLRRQMLKTIFGFDGDCVDLIRDEILRHPTASANRLLLNKWLGDLDTDIMASSSESMTSSDWMLLALSGIGGQASQQKVARAYVQRLLEKGDVHTAATIMIGMGDQNDAIEIYVSHKRYMEALILTCYVYPADWGRQTQLIRKWGEWAVQHGQQQLAIRCFSCTSSEVAEPYFSPPSNVTTFSQVSSTIPELLSPPLSPPGVIPRGPQRNMAKTAALKLVTSFGDNQKAKFFGAQEGRTPIAGAVGLTPIAESALDEGSHTAFLRAPAGLSSFNTPASATRTATPGGFGRARLPSIGEMPTDVATVPKPNADDDTGSEVSRASTNSKSSYRSRGHRRKTSISDATALAAGNSMSRATTASPMMQKTKASQPSNELPGPPPVMFTLQKLESRERNGSRDRKPPDLSIQWPPMESIITGDYMTTPELSAASSHRTAQAGSVGSASHGGKSVRSDLVSSPLTGRSLDPFISSLATARYDKEHRVRERSRDASAATRARSSSRRRDIEGSREDRGRTAARVTKSGKRSPVSPVPMSPEDLIAMGANLGYGENRSESGSTISGYRISKSRNDSQTTARPGSRTASRLRRLSPEPLRSDAKTISRPGSRQAQRATSRSRKASPDGSYVSSVLSRGRSKSRGNAARRSPSSPVPMSPDTYYGAHEKAREENKNSRVETNDKDTSRARQRSVSRARISTSRRSSPEGRQRARSSSRAGSRRADSRPRAGAPRSERREAAHKRSTSDLKAGDLHAMKLERQRKKEAAARELEERRKSLVRRPSAPPILHPDQLSPAVFRPASRNDNPRSDTYSPHNLPVRSQTVSPESMRLASTRFQEPPKITTVPQVGLPATPKAMQHPKYDPSNSDVPDVPQIPGPFQSSVLVEDDTLGPLPQTTFTLLPKTTYQAAARNLPRSVSAPITEEPMSPPAIPGNLPAHPAFSVVLPASSRRRADDTPQYAPGRKVSVSGDAMPGTLGAQISSMDGVIASTRALTPPNDNLTPPPPPPPPAPPILKQLQHLALPPPPPPAPLYRMLTKSAEDVGPRGTGIIEIVMDDENSENENDDDDPTLSSNRNSHGSNHSSNARGSSDATRAELPPPPPRAPLQRHNTSDQLQSRIYAALPSTTFSPTGKAQHARRSSFDQLSAQASVGPSLIPSSMVSDAGHSRGRSISDKENSSSISSRFSRATERMRSGSRGPASLINRTISPPLEAQGTLEIARSPYESNVSGLKHASTTSKVTQLNHETSGGSSNASATQRWVMGERTENDVAVSGPATDVKRPKEGIAGIQIPPRQERHPKEVRREFEKSGMF